MKPPIPDANLFMMCRRLNRSALSPLPAGYHLRPCRPEELDFWKGIHFDDPEQAWAARGEMTAFFDQVYGSDPGAFFRACQFVCDAADRPVGTCFFWKAYGRIQTVHWFKVLRKCEGRGIGRGLLSAVMAELPEAEYPVYLHTQPSSYRAIKLYSDFGFALLDDPQIGPRRNDLARCLPILEAYMPSAVYSQLRIEHAPQSFLDAAASSPVSEF